MILETKGQIYADEFKDKKEFMENTFVKLNNDKFGYDRFNFLYIEDTLNKTARISTIVSSIKKFFKEDWLCQ